MHIENDHWLLFLLPLFLLWAAVAFFNFGRDRRDLGVLGEHNFVLPLRVVWIRRVLKSLLVLAGLFLALLGAVRLQGKPIPGDLNLRGIDVMVVLDVSKSMLTQDMVPNRLEAAKKAILTWLQNRDGDRVGVVIFAGEALVQVPMTLDLEAVSLVLSKADVDSVDRGGTDIGEGIHTALAAFEKDDQAKRGKAILLITDGETTEGASDVAGACREAKEKNIPIIVVGIGTPQGKPIPDGVSFWGESIYKRDGAGNIHISHLDEETLRKIADMTGGVFVQGDSEEGLASIENHLDQLQRTEMKGKGSLQRQEWASTLAAGSALTLLFSFFL
jgi:Ca-activated chloride channel family protein